MLKQIAKRALRMTGRELVAFEVQRLPKPARNSNGLDYYRTAIGNYYLPAEAPDDQIARHMRRGKVFEPEIIEVAKRYVRPGTAVIDVGANFGQMSLLLGQLAGPSGRVYAIEAQKRVFEILEKNIEANGAANVVATFNAADKESGKTFRFPDPDFVRWHAYGSYNLPLDADEGEPVDSIRVDDLPIELPVSFMKVEVQGFDLFAMQGATETISRHRMPILFEFEQRFQDDYGTRFQDYVDFVASIDYEFVETVLDINFLIAPKP